MTTKTRLLKEYRNCKVSNCKNRIWHGGYICSTHRYRFKMYNSYDLPNYSGEPSKLEVEIIPEWSFGKCKVHGYLRENQMYKSHTNHGEYKTKGCRRCVLDRNIKKNYGLPGGIDEYEKLAKEQGGKCLICKTEHICTTDDRTKKRKLSIDHCHSTGKFRGIICAMCNSGLGYFKDSIETLQAAIDYLKLHSISSSSSSSSS